MRPSARLAFLATFLLAAAAYAVPPDAAEVARLRAQGQPALDALLERAGGVGHRPDDPADAALIDAVAGQKDAWASGLFWYTDLDAAEQKAQSEGKPILSLRLLGTLDSELSCANSRFFRVALYPDPRVNQLLRERFVLHWQSERPVPTVTVDFGDGRKLTRTLTGNSIHYVLMPDGTPIDAIPGLYVPAVFAAQVAQAQSLFATLNATPTDRRAQSLRELQRARAEQTSVSLSRMSVPASIPVEPARPLVLAPAAPPAVDAGRLAMSKFSIERPMLRAVAPQGRLVLANPDSPDDAEWRQIAANFLPLSVLSPPGVELFRSKLPPEVADDVAATARALLDFKQTMALDTAINEFQLRQIIRSYFVSGMAGDLEALNKRVYAEVFLTPASDPWLGLGDGTAFLGIDPAVRLVVAERGG